MVFPGSGRFFCMENFAEEFRTGVCGQTDRFLWTVDGGPSRVKGVRARDGGFSVWCRQKGRVRTVRQEPFLRFTPAEIRSGGGELCFAGLVGPPFPMRKQDQYR